jgi:hypothetical protein
MPFCVEPFVFIYCALVFLRLTEAVKVLELELQTKESSAGAAERYFEEEDAFAIENILLATSAQGSPEGFRSEILNLQSWVNTSLDLYRVRMDVWTSKLLHKGITNSIYILSNFQFFS